jgi:chemotaxis signal transduction protein
MPIIWIAWFMGIPIKKREIMMAVSRPPMTTCVIICERQDRSCALASHAVKAVRDVLAENTKIDP